MDEKVTFKALFKELPFKHGYLKCRMIHMAGKSVIQPDILFANGVTKHFFVPQFFYPNQIFFLDEDTGFCTIHIAFPNDTVFRIIFFSEGLTKRCSDGSLVYKCAYAISEGHQNVTPTGVWKLKDQKFLLKLYHHTNDAGKKGITTSKEIWGSKTNIQGNPVLQNIEYGYFTSLGTINNEMDLMSIAMSGEGIAGFLPTNAPNAPAYGTFITVPTKQPTELSQTLWFWVDCELIAPNHLWFHRPIGEMPHYELVLPNVYRVGIKPSATLPFTGKFLTLNDQNRKVFNYVIVGDADAYNGLIAPFNEEESECIGKVQLIGDCDDIISTWKKLANTDQFSGRNVEMVQFPSKDP
ncbi:hypothetical protein GCM10011332_10380 [Terasakiella brassicae]|uniref:Uncharacterized protein n=1 Tax=Terasakiella brassicae TaxID=1634917 RepID=A0A917F7W9_9PROT|nr:hypothetical protein [Terasakiella brassicae]GGF58719.1 hypothetical protein GCM10011332_10380 [Terasakiella brassicae]